MKMCQANGVVVFNDNGLIYVEIPVTVRTERTGDCCTLSLADDLNGAMIQVEVTPAVRKLLKEVL